jgi:hypothetical protein
VGCALLHHTVPRPHRKKVHQDAPYAGFDKRVSKPPARGAVRFRHASPLPHPPRRQVDRGGGVRAARRRMGRINMWRDCVRPRARLVRGRTRRRRSHDPCVRLLPLQARALLVRVPRGPRGLLVAILDQQAHVYGSSRAAVGTSCGRCLPDGLRRARSDELPTGPFSTARRSRRPRRSAQRTSLALGRAAMIGKNRLTWNGLS